jgi:hypothetical protein
VINLHDLERAVRRTSARDRPKSIAYEFWALSRPRARISAGSSLSIRARNDCEHGAFKPRSLHSLRTSKRSRLTLGFWRDL